MSETVIQVEKIGKLYRVGEQSAPMLRDLIAGAMKRPFRSRAKRDNTIWALRDVSFEVKQGEVIGLIGRNGAGKSTLLKILARITRPTEGWAEVRGRIGSLLEVGTGFHYELTGRENVFLSGSVLGMKKAEIQRKFDEIVAFAEVARFLDTPLKHYSSGMQMRLAFAVAAHLEPEILLVDEVLAVGDATFQKKCLGKMDDVARHGRTIVFVSHHMAQIRRLCQRGIWIDGGNVRMEGSAQRVVSSYEAAMVNGSGDKSIEAREAISETRFVNWRIAGSSPDNPHALDHLEPVTIQIDLDVHKPIKNAQHGIALYNHDQQLMFALPLQKFDLEPGEHSFQHTFSMLPVRPGLYTWLVTLYDADTKEIDRWYCGPEMMVATQSFQAPFDEWTGVLNLPSESSLRPRIRPDLQASTKEVIEQDVA